MNKLKILLAEDDLNLGSVLKEYLELQDFAVVLSKDGTEGEKEFDTNEFDMCILDIMMPRMDGFTLAEKIRKRNSAVPIIFLTAKSMQKDKIEGLKIGADDYITKPFSTEELLLRIRAILRRTQSSGSENRIQGSVIFKIGKYKFDSRKSILTCSGNDKKLTSRENELLKLLALNKDEVLERKEALEKIWGEDNYFTSRSMDVYIAKLRNYLKEDDRISIVNVHGKGFRLID